VVRCEIDGVINNKGEDQLLSIKVRTAWNGGMWLVTARQAGLRSD
jgi:hypothetical protein